MRIATCSLCPTQARPVLSTAQLLKPNRTVLGQASCAGLHGRTVTGPRAWHGGVPERVGGPGGSACTVEGPYATQMRPASLVRRGGWGGGEKFAFMRCNVFPNPLEAHPIHSTAPLLQPSGTAIGQPSKSCSERWVGWRPQDHRPTRPISGNFSPPLLRGWVSPQHRRTVPSRACARVRGGGAWRDRAR